MVVVFRIRNKGNRLLKLCCIVIKGPFIHGTDYSRTLSYVRLSFWRMTMTADATIPACLSVYGEI